MRALLFCDWTVVRSGIRQYALAAAVNALVVAAMGLPGAGSGAVALVSSVHGAVVTSGSMMLSFFVFFSLFGADEREGWEAARLTLPVSRRQVVAARYVSLLVTGLALVALTSVVGALASAASAWWRFGAVALLPLSESAVLCVSVLSVFLAYVGLEMPLFFKCGFTRARVYFTLPFLLCMLVALEPVRSLARGLAEGLGELVDRLGSPWPVALAALAVAACVYLASLRVSQRVYARRDF